MKQQKEAARWRLMPLPAVLSALALAGTLMAAPVAQADGFQNGGFENGFQNWTVTQKRVRYHTDINPATGNQWGVGTENRGIDPAHFPPTTYSHLMLRDWDEQDGWSGNGSVSAVIGSSTDTNTDLQIPLFELKSARVGDSQTGNRAAEIRQTAVMSTADVDPEDGKVHLRLAVAPVLDDIGHEGHRQPYFFVEITNKTTGKQLYHTFNFSNETGVPWNRTGNYLWTHWQSIDVAPGPGNLDIGDEVEIVIVAAGCADTGHAGYVYVDSDHTLTNLPGPFVAATAPAYTTAPGSITYTYDYANGGKAPAVNSQVVIRSPQDQRHTATEGTQWNLRVDKTNLPAGCIVTEEQAQYKWEGNNANPADWKTIDIVTCNVGTLNPNNTGSFDLTWVVDGGMKPETINHGNYYIQSASTPPLLGPMVRTEFGPGITSLVDLEASITGPSSAACGIDQSVNYTVVFGNNGPATAPANSVITNTVPAGLTNASWTCTAAGGTVACPAASGTGDISGTVTTAWPQGDTLTYAVSGTMGSCASVTSNPLTYSASVQLPDGAAEKEQYPANNTDGVSTSVGSGLFPLTVESTGAGFGKVTSVLPGINCSKTTPTQCGSTANFGQGATVALYPNANSGSIFTGWSGAGAGACVGTLDIPCVVTMDAAKTVVASFEPPLTINVIQNGGNGTVTPGAVTPGIGIPVVPGGTTEIEVKPDAGYGPVFAGSCFPDVPYTYIGNTLTVGGVPPAKDNCNVEVSFTTAGAGNVTATPNSPVGGTIIGGAKTVNSGGRATWVVIPDTGYKVTEPTDDCPAPAAGSWNSDKTQYTVEPINADCNVTFGFEPGKPKINTVVTPPVGPVIPGTTVSTIVTCTNTGEVSAAGATCTITDPGNVDNWTGPVCVPAQPATLASGAVMQCTYQFDVPPGMVPGTDIPLNGVGNCTNDAACGSTDAKNVKSGLKAATPVPVDNPFALLLLALGLLGLGSRYARKRVA